MFVFNLSAALLSISLEGITSSFWNGIAASEISLGEERFRLPIGLRFRLFRKISAIGSLKR